MMVHRIENTLLIDEFDVHKHLMVQTEDDWEWLRKFFYNHILESFDRKVSNSIFLYCLFYWNYSIFFLFFFLCIHFYIFTYIY
jgi:hypothetical protein